MWFFWPIISNYSQIIYYYKLFDETGQPISGWTGSKTLNGGKAIVEQVIAPEETNKSKTERLWES